MKYILIGRDESRLYLDIDSLEVYEIPLFINLGDTFTNVLTFCSFLIMLVTPIIFIHFKDRLILLSGIFISFALILLALKNNRRMLNEHIFQNKQCIRAKNASTYTVSTYRKYALNNLAKSLIILTTLIIFGFFGIYSLLTDDTFFYPGFLCLNIPIFIFVILWALQPISTIRYYFKYKSYVNNGKC